MPPRGTGTKQHPIEAAILDQREFNGLLNLISVRAQAAPTWVLLKKNEVFFRFMLENSFIVAAFA